jgi:hypothetical protein
MSGAISGPRTRSAYGGIARSAHRGEQVSGIDRLVDECDGAIVQRACARLRRSLTRDDHDRRRNAPARELRLNLESAQAGHVQVEDEAVGAVVAHRLQKLAAGGVRFHLEPERSQQPRERFADVWIVVDDDDHGGRRRHDSV